MLIVAVGWIAVVWAVLIIAANVMATQPGPWPARVAAALLFAAYGATLIKRDRRGVAFTWVVVALFGIAVVLGGLVPLQILVWGALVAFAVYLTKNRSRLGAS